MKIKRREFLSRTALGVGAVALGAPFLSRSEPTPKFHDPFSRLTLGLSKLDVSRVWLGTGVKATKRQSDQTRMGKEKFQKLVREAYDRGIRVFDLADAYGTHPFITPALQGIPRDNYRIVSKIWFRPGNLPEPERPDADVVVARFLREINTDYLDMVLLHCVVSAEWPQELRKQMDILAKLKDKGMIRAHGVSCHSLAALEAAAAEPWVDSVHTRINPYGMSMDGPPEKVTPVLQKIHAAGKGVVGMKIMGEGRLRNDDEKRDASVKFALDLGCVDVLNVGCESVEEIDDLAARVRKVPVKTS